MPELLALVKHDCPVCDQVLPALDAAGVRVALPVHARGDRGAGPAAGAEPNPGARRGSRAVRALRPRRGAGRDAARRRRGARTASRGSSVTRLRESAEAAGVALDARRSARAAPGLRLANPRSRGRRRAGGAPRPGAMAGCAPARSRSADSRIRSRRCTTAVSPTGCRSSRPRPSGSWRCSSTPARPAGSGGPDPALRRRGDGREGGHQRGDGGLRRARSSRSCWPPWRPRAREAFALHGLLATTHPAGPVVVVSGRWPRRRA